MSIKLYTDVHIPYAIVAGLRARSVDVITAQADGSARLSDPALLDRATALDRALFTYDQDFLVEAARRQRAGETFAESFLLTNSMSQLASAFPIWK